jgi:branched-subunit amino acid transport protein AzlD
MTYPPSGSGYPPGQQPTTQFSAPTQQFGKVEQASQAQAPAAAAAGPSKLPVYLLAVVAVCGLLVYLFSFGPMFTISNTDFPQLGSASGTSLGLGLAVLASLLAALLAGASLLPKQKAIPAVVAAISVLAFLLVIAEIVNKPERVSIDWAAEPWSAGCVAGTPPGALTPGAVWRGSHGGIHLAGAEAAVRWPGYMEGAIEAGECAAREVITPDLAG